MIHPLLNPPAHLVRWLRTGLVVVALVFFAGITTKIVVSGNLPFGWSHHWLVNVTFGHVLQNLTYAICLLALLGRVGRRFIVGAVVLALAFPTEGHSLTLITALLLIGLPLWIGLRTLDQVRSTPVGADRALSTLS